MPRTNSPRVIVIGAGSLGLCTALSLTEQGARVTVLEAKSIASGSTGRSVGVVGTQFTDPVEILLRRYAMTHFARWEEAGLRFNHIGYLRLARTRNWRFSASRCECRRRPDLGQSSIGRKS
jgi:sarcosine oxidase subunit beta